MNPCHHSPSFSPPTLAPPVCHAPFVARKHTHKHSLLLWKGPSLSFSLLVKYSRMLTGYTAIIIRKIFWLTFGSDIIKKKKAFKIKKKETFPVSLLYYYDVSLPSECHSTSRGGWVFKFFLEVTQNAIRVNEKPANSIMEANENGTGDSALKAGWAHSPNKPSSVTASLHLN